MTTYADLAAALDFLDPTCPRDFWVNVASAIKNGLGPDGLELFDSWSSAGEGYDAHAVKAVFKSTNACVPVEWIFKEAIARGYKPDKKQLSPAEQAQREQQRAEARAQRLQREQAERELEAQWHAQVGAFCRETLTPLLRRAGQSKYLLAKGVHAFEIYFVPNGLGVVIDSDKQTIQLLKGRDQAAPYFKKENRTDNIWFAYFSRGTIAVPLCDVDNTVHNYQFIFAAGEKKFIKHGRKKGLFHCFGNFSQQFPIVICEGYATAASCHMATGWPCVVAFDCGNLKPVCAAVRGRFPQARIVVAGDDDQKTEGNPGRTKAVEAAQAVKGVSVFPKFADVVNG